MATKRIQRSDYENDPSWLNFIEWFRMDRSGRLEKSKDKIWAIYEEILNMAKGRKVKVTLEEIRVPLGWIWRTILPLGRVEVIFTKRYGALIEFKIKAYDRNLAYFTHPHASPSGGFCLGNVHWGIEEFTRQKQFGLATDLIIQYLRKDSWV